MPNHLLQNPYLNQATARRDLLANQRSKVLDFDIDSGDTWQAWIFSDEGDKSIDVEFVLRGGYGSTGKIDITIGGNASGNLITGTGSCEVFATSEQNATINIWFTPEQTTRSLPSVSSAETVNTSPAYFNIGYPPFGRNNCSVVSTGQFTIQLVDESGTAIFNTVVNTTEEKQFFAGGFIHPSNAELQILNNSPNQKFLITHF